MKCVNVVNSFVALWQKRCLCVRSSSQNTSIRSQRKMASLPRPDAESSATQLSIKSNQDYDASSIMIKTNSQPHAMIIGATNNDDTLDEETMFIKNHNDDDLDEQHNFKTIIIDEHPLSIQEAHDKSPIETSKKGILEKLKKGAHWFFSSQLYANLLMTGTLFTFGGMTEI